jgi:hypothetical protein
VAEGKVPGTRLTHAELALVDALITIAQERNIGLETPEDDDDPPSGAAETVEARHDGIFRLVEEQVLPKIRELTRQMGHAPTLRRLVELRGNAVRHR